MRCCTGYEEYISNTGNHAPEMVEVIWLQPLQQELDHPDQEYICPGRTT